MCGICVSTFVDRLLDVLGIVVEHLCDCRQELGTCQKLSEQLKEHERLSDQGQLQRVSYMSVVLHRKSDRKYLFIVGAGITKIHAHPITMKDVQGIDKVCEMGDCFRILMPRYPR